MRRLVQDNEEITFSFLRLCFFLYLDRFDRNKSLREMKFVKINAGFFKNVKFLKNVKMSTHKYLQKIS